MVQQLSQLNEALTALQSGKDTLIYRRYPSDMLTPVLALQRLRGRSRHCYLLESVLEGTHQGRYSVIGWAPDLIWRCQNGTVATARLDASVFGKNNSVGAEIFISEKTKPLQQLRRNAKAAQIAQLPANLPPLAAGLFGYFSYDMIRQVENLADQNPPLVQVPDALFIRPTLTAIFDHVAQTLILSAVLRSAPGIPGKDIVEQGRRKLDEAEACLFAEPTRGEQPVDRLTSPVPLSNDLAFGDPHEGVYSNLSKEAFVEKVERAKEYIRAGDIFQIVLSQCFQSGFDEDPFELYRALRRINPSPYLFYFDFADFQLVGSSPELLVGVEQNKIRIRPIAGTRPRGSTKREDDQLAENLLADEKECAEHLMLLDLARHDVGRFAQPASVEVVKQFTIEKYSHVMHIVSEVTGLLADDADPLDALFAGFPAGTVSGAPKIRAMELIDELEPSRRGPYAGAAGYFGANGDLDSCILLRTGLVKDGQLYVQAGGGIVFDSDAHSEYEECRNKAKAVLSAARWVKAAAGVVNH